MKLKAYENLLINLIKIIKSKPYFLTQAQLDESSEM
jgi:hypothetical protein